MIRSILYILIIFLVDRGRHPTADVVGKLRIVDSASPGKCGVVELKKKEKVNGEGRQK